MRVYAHMSGLFKASREFSPRFFRNLALCGWLGVISTTLLVGLASSDGLNLRAWIDLALVGIRPSCARCRGANGEADGQSPALRRVLASALCCRRVRAVACCPHRGSHGAHRLWPAVHAVGYLDCEQNSDWGFRGYCCASRHGARDEHFRADHRRNISRRVVDFGLDFVPNGVKLALHGTGSIRGLARTTGPVALPVIPLYTSLVGVLVYCYLVLRRGSPRRSSFLHSPRNGFSSFTSAGPSTGRAWGSQR